VNLAVSPGELILVTGASGCGKSTLALALAGLIPTRVHGEMRGRVTFDGKPLSGLAPHEVAQFVGLVFQNPNLQLINMTVKSEVAFGPENLALPSAEITARVDWALEVTGMAGMRAATVTTLSGGQKQRTAIAATLAMRPRLLVLDEPLSDLDPVGAQEVLGTLRRLAREHGTGVIIIEHRVDEVVPWADRIVLMDDGRIVLDRPPRGAWDDAAPWLATGVGIPDVVRLPRRCRTRFPPERRCRWRRPQRRCVAAGSRRRSRAAWPIGRRRAAAGEGGRVRWSPACAREATQNWPCCPGST
jgi:energy-coupling factor transport system ATP-binding protein